MDPKEVSSRLNDIADRIDASKNPSRVLIASALRDTIAAVERNKDKEKKKKKECLNRFRFSFSLFLLPPA